MRGRLGGYAVRHERLRIFLRVDQVERRLVRLCDKNAARVIDEPMPVIPKVGQIKHVVGTHHQSPSEMGHGREGYQTGLRYVRRLCIIAIF